MALASAAPAAAAWRRATTEHFVIYADASQEALQDRATELEMFDAVIRRFHQAPDNPDASFNKVTVYVLPNLNALQALAGSRDIAGFYVPRASGSVAFTPSGWDTNSPYELSGRIVMFHEYAHHFLLGNYVNAYPAWFSEGYAEFVSTMAAKKDEFWVGAAANHRGYSLFASVQLRAAELFAPPERMSRDQVAVLYARGWLLTHLIMFDPKRNEQSQTYLRLLNSGTPNLEAARQAFGDLKQLDKELDAYKQRRMLPVRIVKRDSVPTPKVDIRPLTPGEAALIRLRMESTRGVDSESAKPLYARAKVAAAPYRNDPVAQGWLAEMALDAGDDAAAEAACDAALAVDPKSGQALLYKARVHLQRAEAAKASDPAVWSEARSWIIKANHAETNNAAALLLFYLSFKMQGGSMAKSAVPALYRAAQLVPQDESVRFMAAQQMIRDGKLDDAKQMLRPLAFDPHGDPDNPAAKLLARLDAGAKGEAALQGLD